VLENQRPPKWFLRSAKGAARTANRTRNSPAPRSVLREFLKTAKGAARTANRTGNSPAPHSVLREFLKTLNGHAFGDRKATD
jgi:hypothetical protein